MADGIPELEAAVRASLKPTATHRRWGCEDSGKWRRNGGEPQGSG